MTRTGAVSHRTGRLSAADRAELATLRRQFHAAGWHRKPTARLLRDLAMLVLATAAGLAMVAFGSNVLVYAAGLLVATAGTAGVATHTHSSSHFATSSRRWINQALTYFGYPFFVGLSATYWHHKHLTIHHVAPNVIGVDDDADLSPWFALTCEDAERGGPVAAMYYRRIQPWVFPIAIAANGFNMQALGWRFVSRALARPDRRLEHVLDLGSLLMHYAVFVALPMLWFAPYPGMPWMSEDIDPDQQKRFERVLKIGPKLHRAVQPLEKARTRLAHLTDRGNTYRVLARKQA